MVLMELSRGADDGGDPEVWARAISIPPGTREVYVRRQRCEVPLARLATTNGDGVMLVLGSTENIVQGRMGGRR